ncbi:MAG: helix-turn-helix domain-containing protein [Tannerellaceae bacterium]|nr:helix-turn-helix domain-containing protein [Tannerellaceae bacterium]
MSEQDYEKIKNQLDRVEKFTLLGAKSIFDIDEAALYTGIKKGTLYTMTMNQKIPYYKPNGKKIYFKREELDDWLTQNRISTKEEIDQKATTFITTKK